MTIFYHLLQKASTSSTAAVTQLRALKMLPTFLHEVTIGQLLGDAACMAYSPTSNSRLEWSFGVQRELYALYIQSLYMDYLGTLLTSRFVSVVRGGLKSHLSYRLKTLSLPVFNLYRNLFYELNPITGKYVKIVPSNIIDLLTPVVLAHLIMGDGNFKLDANTVRIYTNGFSLSDNNRLASAIMAKLGIYVEVKHDRRNQYILSIGPKELRKLQELVSPHMHSSMLYRIGL